MSKRQRTSRAKDHMSGKAIPAGPVDIKGNTVVVKRLVLAATSQGLSSFETFDANLESIPSNEGRVKLLRWLDYMAETGQVPKGEERCRSLGDGLFELKPGNYRVFFFYDEKRKRTVILTHCYKKQGQKTPMRQIKLARERLEVFVDAQMRNEVRYELD